MTPAERNSARAKFQAAVRSGRLVRPTTCQRCRKSGRKIHGHHNDYCQPFAVEWLCQKCHTQVHLSFWHDIPSVQIDIDRVGDELRKRGWTGKELAAAIGCHPTLIDRWLKRNHQSAYLGGHAAYALGVSLDTLVLAGENQKSA